MNNQLMKSIFTGVAIFVLAWACQPPPELPVIPKISYNRVDFYPVETASDSIILQINFEDGDGDIGLYSTDDEYPYNPFNFIWDNKGDYVFLGGDSYELPFYSVPIGRDGFPDEEPKLFSETDTRQPFNCQQYEILQYTLAGQSQVLTDTFFIQKNVNNKNIYVDFFRKVDGSYEFLDWAYVFEREGCGFDFNSRFPVFDSDNIGKSLSGTLRYAMVSEGFEITLKQDTFKLRIYIKDRALHDSNVIETPDLTLNNISR